MSGDVGGVIVVPVVLCMAAPIVVAGVAIAGVAVAVGGAVKLGGIAFDSYNKNKKKKAEELENSGLIPQVAAAYKSIVEESQKIASIYNRQTLRVTDEMEKRRRQWEEILNSNDVKLQMEFQEKVTDFRRNLAEYEREKTKALKEEIQNLTDAQDRELNRALREVNERIEAGIHEWKTAMENAAKESEGYAQEYHKSAKMLLKTLKEDYQGEKFCSNELLEIQELMDKSEEVLDMAPQASYAIIWDAVEKSLLAINKAENMQQEWLMQYRTALVLAEEIKAVFEYEGTLGYLVEGTYKQTRQEAETYCRENGLNPQDIRELKADEYVYGELADLKREFQEEYTKLHDKNGQDMLLEELYTVIDDLNVKYAARTRKLIFEAKMNLNEALLIDRVETQLNDALGGGYHSTGSARGGDCHNGEKHIIFERDGNPEEQICVVLRNGGWGDDGDGQTVLNTEVDLKVIKDNRISEKKRRQLRKRICDYLNAGMEGAQVNMSCVKGTENTLTRDTSAGNLREVRRRKVTR